MKKTFIVIWSIFFSYHVSSCEIYNKTKYTTENNNITNTPKIIDFFSFFCPYCYELKKKYNIKQLIEKNINQNIQFQTYHVNFLGGKFSYILTKSWIIAQCIGIEEKVMLPLFEGIQITHKIKNLDSIKDLFKKEADINESQFNSFWDSLKLNVLVQKKNEDIKKSHLDYVPSMLINKKYLIDYSFLENKFQDNFPEQCIKLIKFLIKKK